MGCHNSGNGGTVGDFEVVMRRVLVDAVELHAVGRVIYNGSVRQPNSPLDPMKKICDLEIQEELGRGSHAIVYRATRGGESYAVKILKDATQTDKALPVQHFWSEAAFVASLNHSGLLKIKEVGETKGERYLVMELLPRETLASAITKGPVPISRVLGVAREMAGALQEIHRHGLIHRDIKPENIILGETFVAKLIDFGLAAYSRQASESFAGTFLYSSPEQTGIIDSPVDGRSDLYCLGGVLYHALAGRPPFASSNVEELIQQHGYQAVPDLRGFRSDVPSPLLEIINKLLAKEPRDRYQTAAALAADLSAYEEIKSRIATGKSPLLGSRVSSDDIDEQPLIGRAEPMSRVLSAVESISSGKGRLVIVEGEPGSGKTHLVREVLRREVKSQRLIWRGKCNASDPMPFAVFRSVLRAHLDSLGGLSDSRKAAEIELLRECAGAFAPLIRGLAPELAELWKDLPEWERGESSSEQFYEAVQELLLRLAEKKRGLVVFIDDIQWMDVGTTEVLKRISNRLTKTPLIFLCTARTDSQSTKFLNAFTESLGEKALVRVSLGKLDLDSLSLLVANLLGGDGLGKEAVENLANRCDSNPFAMGEFVRALLEAGSLRPSWGKWVLSRRASKS